MTSNEMTVMEKALAAGGSKLSQTALGGSSKPVKEAVKALLDAKRLTKEGTKYTVTPEGRQIWEQEATAEQRAYIRDIEERREEESLIALLDAVKSKAGKSFTSNQLNNFSAVVDKAQSMKLITRGEKDRAFELQHAGEVYVLRHQVRCLYQPWSELGEQIRNELSLLDTSSSEPLIRAESEIAERIEQSHRTFVSALEELQGFTHLIKAAQQFQQSFGDIRQTLLQEVESKQEQLQALQNSLEEKLSQLDSIKAEREELVRRIIEVPSPTQPTEEITDDQLWAITKEAYERIWAVEKMTGSSVTIPVLLDEVQRKCSVTIETMHAKLKQWAREDKILLQVCNDPHLEPRASEGLHSERGLLLYIEIR